MSNSKLNASIEAIEYIKPKIDINSIIGVGTGSTVNYFIEGKTNWTFWGYRGGGWQKGNGLRIDHILTTSDITDKIKNVEIIRDPRAWEKASDHTPVTITLEN